MPGWEFDRKTMQMVPKKKSGLEFYSVAGGLKVVDNDLNTSFIILRRTDEISYMQGVIATKGPKLWDYRKAMEISNRVQRVMPASKYTDYKLFCRTIREQQMSDEDYALLEKLTTRYDNNKLSEAVDIIAENALNETFFSVKNITASDERTIGMQKHGLKGLAYAIPSAAVAFLFCPPLAIIGLLGALRVRSEKSWLTGKIASAFNTKTWLDYISTPNSDKEKMKERLKEKTKEAFAKNTKYYYTELENGEILKVPAATTSEARDMILAIEKADIIKRYNNFNQVFYHVEDESPVQGILDTNTGNFYGNLCNAAGDPVKMWCIKFNDGQVCYGFGEDGQKDEVMKSATESKKAVVEYYKKVVLHKEDGDYDEDVTMKHDSIGKKYRKEDDPEDYIDELFLPPKIDDVIEISAPGMYSPITSENFKKFSTPTTSAPTWQSRKFPSFTVPINDDNNFKVIEFNLVGSSSNEIQEILRRIKRGMVGFSNKAKMVNMLKTQSEANQNNTQQQYKFTILSVDANRSKFEIPVIDDRVVDPSTGDPIKDKFNNTIKANLANNSNNYLFLSDAKVIVREIKQFLELGYDSHYVSQQLREEYKLYQTSETFDEKRNETNFPNWVYINDEVLNNRSTVTLDCEMHSSSRGTVQYPIAV